MGCLRRAQVGKRAARDTLRYSIARRRKNAVDLSIFYYFLGAFISFWVRHSAVRSTVLYCTGMRQLTNRNRQSQRGSLATAVKPASRFSKHRLVRSLAGNFPSTQEKHASLPFVVRSLPEPIFCTSDCSLSPPPL